MVFYVVYDFRGIDVFWGDEVMDFVVDDDCCGMGDFWC